MSYASLIGSLAHWLAPWQAAYSGSKVIETAVTSVHLLALLLGGGLAVAADRAMLRALGAGPQARDVALRAIQATHRPVVIALSVSFLSGLALATADINTFANSPVFLVKLTLVGLLCINGLFLLFTERALQRHAAVEIAAPLWRRLRAATWLSITLWMSTLIAGVTLVNAA
jgi:hypothetical protein